MKGDREDPVTERDMPFVVREAGWVWFQTPTIPGQSDPLPSGYHLAGGVAIERLVSVPGTNSAYPVPQIN